MLLFVLKKDSAIFYAEKSSTSTEKAQFVLVPEHNLCLLTTKLWVLYFRHMVTLLKLRKNTCKTYRAKTLELRLRKGDFDFVVPHHLTAVTDFE